MAKKIPKKVNPDSIIKAIFQIRFTLNIPGNELLGHLYPILGKNFPKLEQKNVGIPEEIIKMDPQLKFLPNYAFSNSEFSISVGNNVLSFEYLSSYRGWDDFYSKIENVLHNTNDLKIFASTDRLSLRYINIIDSDRLVEDVIDFQLKLGLAENFVERNAVFKKEFESDDIRIMLNIAENVRLRSKQSTSLKKGILIDLDVSQTKELPRVGAGLLPIISNLHEKEKFIFFNILKQEFIDSLNPIY